MLTEETLEALRRGRAAVGRYVDGTTDDLAAAWLQALVETRAEIEAALGDPDFVARLRLSERVIGERLAELQSEGTAQLSRTAQLMAENAASIQEAMIATQLPDGWGIHFHRPDSGALAAIIQRTTEQITVRNYYLSADATQAVQQALRIGISGGINPYDIANRMLRAVDGAFFGGLARAVVIARTELLDAHRAASHATYKANGDILSGWQWWTNLDDKTCISCISQHGNVYPLDEPGPLDHHQGRCASLPVTKTWRELGIDADEPPGLEIESGVDWLTRQPPDVQRSIMGPARYEAWRAGHYPPEKWSERRSSTGWRDAYHTSAAPKSPGGGRSGTPARPPPSWRTMPPEAPADAAARANPKFHDGREYQINCSSCTVAWTQRRRGFDVTAGPRTEGRYIRESLAAWADNEGNPPSLLWLPGNGIRGLSKYAETIPDGAYGMIRADWKGRGNGGHIWVWEKTGGRIVQFDPQLGRVDVDYFDRVRARSVALFRTDGYRFIGAPKEFLEWS